MKAPRYIKIKPQTGNRHGLTYTVSIKWWGWPIILFKTMRDRTIARWYMWPFVWLYLYPSVCVHAMRGAVDGN